MPDDLDSAINQGGAAAMLGVVLGGILLYQEMGKSGEYQKEAEYEAAAPGTVIGVCEKVTFAEGRPRQVIQKTG